MMSTPWFYGFYFPKHRHLNFSSTSRHWHWLFGMMRYPDNCIPRAMITEVTKRSKENSNKIQKKIITLRILKNNLKVRRGKEQWLNRENDIIEWPNYKYWEEMPIATSQEMWYQMAFLTVEPMPPWHVKGCRLTLSKGVPNDTFKFCTNTNMARQRVPSRS